MEETKTSQEEMKSPLFTIQEVTEYLRISIATLHRLVRDKKLTPVRIYGKTLFDRKDLQTFIEQAKQHARDKPGKKRGRKPLKRSRAPKQDEPSAGHKKSARSTRGRR